MDRMLLIETSGRVGKVGIAERRSLLAERVLDETRRHARDLAPAIAELLREQGWKSRDVTAAIVSAGPGSYTGLRVGIMSAKVFAFATGCALIGVPTFDIIAFQAQTPATELVLVADAQRDQVYVQTFRRQAAEDRFRSAADVAVVVVDGLVGVFSPDAAVAGPGLDKIKRQLPKQTVAGAEHPSLAGLLAVGLERYERGERDDPLRLEPMYLLRSSAEEQWDRRPSP
jgi:tRNA threonylcarbamoyladenosine biosynthesis protein TsaB